MCFMGNIYTLLIWCKADFIELGGEAHKTVYSSTQQMCKKLELEKVWKTAFSQMFSTLTDGVRFNRNSGDGSLFVIVTITCNRFM